MDTTRELLDVAAIRKLTGLGRDMSIALIRHLPHVTLGRSGKGLKRLIRRPDLDLFLTRAAQEERDLWDLVKDFTPEELRSWMASGPKGMN